MVSLVCQALYTSERKRACVTSITCFGFDFPSCCKQSHALLLEVQRPKQMFCRSALTNAEQLPYTKFFCLSTITLQFMVVMNHIVKFNLMLPLKLHFHFHLLIRTLWFIHLTTGFQRDHYSIYSISASLFWFVCGSLFFLNVFASELNMLPPPHNLCQRISSHFIWKLHDTEIRTVEQW